jgi:tetratricopeptide (TPR) repeat protein
MRRFLPVALVVAFLGASASADAQLDREQTPAPPSEPAASSGAIDKLYARLARTRYPEEAEGILAEIDHLRRQSGSDTADLLLARAMKARESAKFDIALPLFDTVVDLYPDWSEAWSERATARFQNGDVDGAMGDLAQTLKRDPRDIGALAGLGSILTDAGEPEGALRAFDRALALAPAYERLKEARARAQNLLWSRSP